MFNDSDDRENECKLQSKVAPIREDRKYLASDKLRIKSRKTRMDTSPPRFRQISKLLRYFVSNL